MFKFPNEKQFNLNQGPGEGGGVGIQIPSTKFFVTKIPILPLKFSVNSKKFEPSLEKFLPTPLLLILKFNKYQIVKPQKQKRVCARMLEFKLTSIFLMKF